MQILRSFSVVALPWRLCLSLFVASITLGEMCSANDASSFGRILPTGEWSDLGWVDTAGVVTGLPAGPVSSVWIGGKDRPSPGALAEAALDVSGTVSAVTINVGDAPGDNGKLVVRAGADVTAQTVLLGRNGGAAELVIEPGGKLAAQAILQVGSPTGAATIRLNGQSVTTSQFIQFGAVDFVRDGGGIHGDSLWVINPNAHFEYTDADSFNSGVVDSGASLTFSAPASLLGGLRVSGGATVIVDAPLDVAGDVTGLLVTGAGTTLTANAPTRSVSLGAKILVDDNAVFAANVDIKTISLIDVERGALLQALTVRIEAGALLVNSGGMYQRTTGSYAVDDLEWNGTGTLHLRSGDVIRHRFYVGPNATFVLDRSLVLAGATDSMTTVGIKGRLVMGGNQVVADYLRLYQGSTLDRGSGGHFRVKILSCDGNEYVVDGRDRISESISATNGANVVIATPMNLQRAWALSGSKFIIDAPLVIATGFFSQMSVRGSGAELTINAPGTTFPQLLVWESATAYINTSLTVRSVLEIGSVGMFDPASVRVSPRNGVLSQLTVEGSGFALRDGATLELSFEDVEPRIGLNWAFRCHGSLTELLEEKLGSQIVVVGAPQEVQVIHRGGFAYIGYEVIPEPSSALMSGAACFLLACTRMVRSR